MTPRNDGKIRYFDFGMPDGDWYRFSTDGTVAKICFDDSDGIWLFALEFDDAAEVTKRLAGLIEPDFIFNPRIADEKDRTMETSEEK